MINGYEEIRHERLMNTKRYDTNEICIRIYTTRMINENEETTTPMNNENKEMRHK